MNKDLEMLEVVRGEYQMTMDAWSELEDILVQATKQAGFRMEEDDDGDSLLKLSAISVFVSRIQYIFHTKLKALEEEATKLEKKTTMRDIRIPVGK